MPGKKGAGDQQTVSYQTKLPEYAQAWYEPLMDVASKEIGDRMGYRLVESEDGGYGEVLRNPDTGEPMGAYQPYAEIDPATGEKYQRVAPVSWQQQAAGTGIERFALGYEDPQGNYIGPSGSDYERTTRQYMDQAAAIPGQAQQIESSYNPANIDISGLGSSYRPGGIRAGQAQSSYQPGVFGTDQYASRYAPGQFQAGYTPGQFDIGGQFGLEQAQQYMDPYQQSVTQRAMDVEEQKYQTERDLRAAKIAEGGGRGGYREALMDVVGQGENRRNQAMIAERGASQAYQSAQAQFERDRAAQMQAMGMADEAQRARGAMGLQAAGMGDAAGRARGEMDLAEAQRRLQAAGMGDIAGRERGAQDIQLGLGNIQNQLSAWQLQDAARRARGEHDLATGAQQLQGIQIGDAAQRARGEQDIASGLGTQQGQLGYFGGLGELARTGAGLGELERGADLQRMQQLEQVGSLAQQREQQRLDLAREDFYRKQNYIPTELARYAALIQGVPITPEQTQTTTLPGVNPFSQAMGAWLGVAAMGDMMNWWGS